MSLDQYKRLRNAMITFAIILTLGCVFGIQQTQYGTAHSDWATCEGSKDGRQVLRNLLDATNKQPQLKTNNPELKKILAEAKKANGKFVREQKALVPIRQCGDEPHRFVLFG